MDVLYFPWSNDLSPFAFYSFTSTQFYWMLLTIRIFELLFGLAIAIKGKQGLQTLCFTAGSMIFLLNAYIVFGGTQGQQSISTVAALIGVSFAASILGAFMFMFVLLPFITFLFGGLFGALLALSILSIAPATTNLVSFLFIFAFAYIGGLLSFLWQEIFLVFGSALVGSALMADAIDKMALHTDFMQIILGELAYIVSFDSNLEFPLFEKSKNYWIIFGVTAGVAALSCILQFTLTAKSQFFADIFRLIGDAERKPDVPIYEIEVKDPGHEIKDQLMHPDQRESVEFDGCEELSI